MKTLRSAYVSMIYADHNKDREVKSALERLLGSFGPDDFILNVGSGQNRIRSDVKNLDIVPGPNVDFVGSAENIPLADEHVDLIVTQEAFEHITNPETALRECYRILKFGGKIFFQVPFIIGYHPGPTDYLRFTREGVIEIISRNGFRIEKVEISVAGATGFYRVAVEFFAILLSGPISRLYHPMKALFALVLYPLKWLDPWFRLSEQKDRIPGGYFVIASKDP